MTSFTKQLRMGLRTAARENIEPAPELGPEEIQATLAEPVAAEIEQDVVAPAADIEQGNAALMEADTDANTLENTAAIVEGSIGDGTTDVDVATSELANITVERIAAKYGMARAVKVSKESFGTAENRLAMARSISKEAMEQAGELRKRVSEGVAKIIEWFKNLIKSVFDKRTKLEKRFQAIKASVKAKQGFVAKDGTKIKVTTNLTTAGSTAAAEMIKSFKIVGELAEENAASLTGRADETFDFNPEKLYDLTLTAKLEGGRLVVTKTSDPHGTTETDPLSLDDIKSAADRGDKILKDLKAAEAECNKIIAAMGGAAQKLKAVVTGKEDDASASRTNILARYQGVTTLAGTISATVLRFLSDVSSACEQSLAAYEAPAAAA